MSDLTTRFETAAAEVQQLPRRPDNLAMLQLYALYKQSTVGNVTGSRPGFMDMVGQAKYDAWTKVKGTSKEQAMQQYIDLVERLKSTGGR